MKERGILFSAPMVKALLAGTKTMTRRIVKPQPEHPLTEMDKTDPVRGWQIPGHSGIWNYDDATGRRWKCRYGIPGDRLFVKETFGHAITTDGESCVYYPADGSALFGWADQNGEGDMVYVEGTAKLASIPQTLKPSLFMPRWASRITLEITGVRCERLRDISLADVFAEGCCLSTDKADLRDFQNLWDSIHGKGAWDKNPWLWCISFKRLSVQPIPADLMIREFPV